MSHHDEADEKSPQLEWSVPAPARALPNLLIKQGEKLPIPSGSRLNYGTIQIDHGGVLEISGPLKKWTMIRTAGDFVLRGTIVVRGFRAQLVGVETVEEVAPDGQVLRATYENNRAGGAGGSGGGWSPWPGGNGAPGSPFSGGGGGGGAGNDGHRNGRRIRGNDGLGADGGSGGEIPGGTGGSGGPGGRRDIGDGGLLYIRCEANFRGDDGVIDVRGDVGPGGASGANSSPGGGGGGGGGGGAPGHNGGSLVLNVIGDLVSPTVQLEGGAGGPAAGGGSSTQTYPPNPPGWPQGATSSAGSSGNAGTLVLVGDWPPYTTAAR